jgi:putative ABC transport system permease protein
MPQDSIPSETVIELNAPVLVFTLCVAVVTALIFGLAPAAQLCRHDMNDALRDSGKGVSGAFQGKWLRDAVVIGEVALSLTLLMGAGLLMRSFVRLRQVNLGLRADHVFQTAVVLPEERYKTVEQVSAFYRPLLERLKALPGVVDTATSTSLPPFNFTESKIEIAGKSHREDWQSLFQNVSEEYFRTLGIDFKQGRGFNQGEVNGARRLVVVNQTFVRKYLGNENPIGQHVRLTNLQGVADPSFEIIGVVADVANRGLQAPIEPELWVPYTITTPERQVLIVRTAQDPGTIQDLVQKEVWAADSGVALAFPGPLDDSISKYLYAGPRFGLVLMTIFACVGLILVTVGVYSVLAYSTTRKTHEIGIRMALGAGSADVLSLVVGTGLRLVVVGMAIGTLISLTLGRFIGTELVGVRVYDPATLVMTTLLLAATAAVACWIPARRATRLDPMVALRYE